MLVRVTATALICVTVLQLAVYFADWRFHDRPLPVLSCMLWTIPFLIAVLLLVKSKAVAGWISEKLE